MDFAVPMKHRVKVKKRGKLDKYLDLARELKNVVEHESYGDTKFSWHALNGLP